MTHNENRCLWKQPESPRAKATIIPETYESIHARFASIPPKRSLWQLVSNSLVVVQEISLTVYLLARHRVLLQASASGEPQEHAQAVSSSNVTRSTLIMITALLLVLFYGSRVETKQNKHVKLKQRATDVLLSAILLRFLASLLQSLTASYASDTMYALVMAGFVLHVLACDYSYANGHARYKDYEHATKRPIFHGGTVSLNSALFSTTLLVSRLQIVEAYFFVYFAVVLFAFYPVTRNIIAVVYPARKSVALWLITTLVCSATFLILETMQEIILFASVLSLIGWVLPTWRCVVQNYKVSLSGPWDIPVVIS